MISVNFAIIIILGTILISFALSMIFAHKQIKFHTENIVNENKVVWAVLEELLNELPEDKRKEFENREIEVNI